MQPQKRMKTAFVPYRMRAESYEYYLQKRDRAAPTHPGMFSMFGGSSDPEETPEQCVLREVLEELHYVPRHIHYFGSVERIESHCDVFIEKVDKDFESQVVVDEGEFGVFLTFEEAKKGPINPLALVVLESLDDSMLKFSRTIV